MNTYPAIRQSEGTQLIARSIAVERYATNGTLRMRYVSSNRKHDIVVVHGAIDASERAQLLAFYEANRTDPFVFVAVEDGVSRICIFTPTPLAIEPIPGTVATYNVTAYMREM